MIFINETGTIATILASGTTNLTGSMTATLFLILLFILLVALMFQIPLEYLAILILPFCISVAAFYGVFMIPLVLILIYLSAILAKHFFFK